MARQIPEGLLAEAGSILIVKPSSLGDIVHTLPALSALCAAHPHLEARWVVNAGWEALLEGNPNLQEVIAFPRKEMRGLAAVPRFLRWRKELRNKGRKRPEVVLDFQGLFRSGMISRARGAEATVGLSDAREGARHFYRHVVEVDAKAHAVARYLRVPEALGVGVPPVDELVWNLPGGDEVQGMEVPDGFVLLHPYSRGKGKSLRAERIVELCRHLAGVPVVLVGQRGGEEKVALPDHVTDLTDRTTIPQLIWLMRQAAFSVSVDSGPMHLAAAVDGARLLGIHTWTDPRKVGPYAPAARVWKAGEIRAFDAWDDAEAAHDVEPEGVAMEAIAAHVRAQISGGK